MIAELKKLLSECHVKAGDRVIEMLSRCNPDYLLARIEEELIEAQNEKHQDRVLLRLMRIIQIANLTRYVLCNHSDLAKPSPMDPKQ